MSELAELRITPVQVAQAPAPYLVPVLLSARERRLLELLAEGCTNAQIGLLLHRSDKTVRNQLTSLYRKLGAANRAEAVALFLTRHQIASGLAS
jgi:DNA-binding NarL/FixJ family response regulator